MLLLGRARIVIYNVYQRSRLYARYLCSRDALGLKAGRPSAARDDRVSCIQRSRVQWVEEGERSTKFFFGLEKSNGKKNSIGKPIKPDKSVLQDQEGISKQIVDFYQTLYKSTTPNINNHMYARYLCSRAHSAARPRARATIGYLIYKITSIRKITFKIQMLRLLTARCRVTLMVRLLLMIWIRLWGV